PRLAGRVDPSDVVQETWTTAIAQLPDYLRNQQIPFYPWIRRIAWQKLVDERRRHLDAAKRSVKRERRGCFEGESTSISEAGLAVVGRTTPSRDAVRRETLQSVREALDRLDELDREVLLQRYLERMSVGEIASFWEMSPEAIRMRQLRALRKLRRLLDVEDQV
ncbi:MAG: sigma-70 family RNA polymerase sigma factor, partial [Planctomycetales bacterium]|nr:sigma-70 family RNA polymerase sigma factor [Planctomycetales bacterium]